MKIARFSPAGMHVTVKISVGSSASATPFDDQLPPAGSFRKSSAVRLFNAGPDTAFIEICGQTGTDQTVTTASGYPIPAGHTEVILTNGGTAIAAISPTTATLYATPGEGI